MGDCTVVPLTPRTAPLTGRNAAQCERLIPSPRTGADGELAGRRLDVAHEHVVGVGEGLDAVGEENGRDAVHVDSRIAESGLRHVPPTSPASSSIAWRASIPRSMRVSMVARGIVLTVSRAMRLRT